MQQIPGPNGPISYERDALGYPRVYARGREEAAFAQGWLHAEDRMVQVYLQVAIARGRIMQHAGERPAFRMLDRGFRRLHLERDAAPEAAAAPPRTQSVVNAYCAGWNARAQTRRKPWLLRLLGITVEPMTPAIVVILLRAVSFLGLASLQQRAEEVIAEIAVEGASEKGLRALLGDAANGVDLEALANVTIPYRRSLLQRPAGVGSSAWVVGPGRSASGAALLACDFHLEVGRIPPYLYLFHLDLGAGDYLIGVSLPGTPTLLAGRNPDLAWGATYAYGDTVDLLVERCRDGRYLAGSEWQPLRRREEVVRIRGRRSERWVYYENDYGVLDADATQPGDYLALRWTGAGGHGRESLDAVTGIETCRDAVSGARHMAKGRTHSIHYVFADREGHIAYSQSGAIDERPKGWSGAYPRPAWDDATRTPRFLPGESLPMIVDPPDGLIVSANERVDGPGGEQLATLPHPSYRAARLRQLLNASPAIDLKTMARAQYDNADLGAEGLLRVWQKHLPAGSESAALVRWGAQQGALAGDASNGSAGTSQLALFHALHREVANELLTALIGPRAARHFTEESELFLAFQHQIDRVLRLEEPELLDESGLAALLARAWPKAMKRIPDGIEVPLRAKFKNAYFEGRLPAWMGFDSPKMDIPGGPHAPFQSRVVRLEGLEVVVGPLFHLVFDMSRPGGWYNFAGGASELKRGPGYGAGLEDWRLGRFLPLGGPEGEPPNLC